MRPALTPSSIKIPDAELTRTELAALRGYVYGMEIGDISDRYFRLTDASLKALVNRAINLLHKHGRIAEAAALRKGPRQDDTGIKRALAALADAERLGAALPAPEHPVGAWFIRHLARRLEAANMQTMGDLVARMNASGPGWWRNVKGIGKLAALSITKFVQAYSAQFGVEIKEFIKPPALPSTVGATVLIFPGTPALAPIERLRVKGELSGAAGRNRGPLAQCRLYAENDLEAIRTWLSLYPDNGHTYRAYRKEAERFLLWCIVHKGRALSDVLAEDCIAYREFLKDPSPTFTWVGSVSKRFSGDWRPFQGALSHTSAAHAITILKSMFEWLVRQGYLLGNPFDALPKNPRPPRIAVEKALSLAAWESVYAWGLEQKNDTFVTALAFLTIMRDCGLRRTEVVHLTRGDLVFNDGWQATFEGKGGRIRTVPLSKSVICAIEAHLNSRELSLETMGVDKPLIAPKMYLEANAALREENFGYTEQGLWRIIKGFFKAYTAENGSFEGRDLSKVTPHMLRHTFGVHALELDVPIDVVQQTLGHASLATTTIYSQGDIKRRTRELAKLFGE